jgi:hypothetical protein
VVTLEKYTSGQNISLEEIEMIETRKARKNLAIEFEQDGKVKTGQHLVTYDRPNYKIYASSEKVEPEPCCFCGGMSNEEALREKLGPVYGPIKVKGIKVYMHEQCALWTPEVYLNDDNKFVDLKKALKRCKNLRCSFCADKGAGLGCLNKECKETYHYLCAKESKCLFVQSKFCIYCPAHRLTDATAEQLREEEEEHDEDPLLQTYFCSICKSGLDESLILICDNCDKGYHTNCHKPPVDLGSIESEDWFCYNCQKEEEKAITVQEILES